MLCQMCDRLNVEDLMELKRTNERHAKRINGKQIGHFPPVDDLGSEENFGIAREWIQNCIETHTHCSPVEDKILPTRLVDVGSEGNDPRLVQTSGLKGKYLALSHCWGGSISNCLTSAAMQAFQEKIPSSESPSNFRDAVLITRGLGFRYLWIDSLCIIQDSELDWELESTNMGNIFQNAFLSIAAARSLNANDGILNAKSLARPLDTQWIELDSLHDEVVDRAKAPLTIWRDRKSDDTVDAVIAETRETLETIHNTGPLSHRGWTLQEQVLSPRILFFGSRQIFWRCLHGYLAADGIPVHDDSIESYASFLPSFHVHSRPPDFSLEDVMAGYHRLVMAYSNRKLTRESDKLPAFGGIAAYVHSLMGGHYLAGIMSSCFREGLLWHSPTYPVKNTIHLHWAPSWSWAVVDGTINLSRRLFPSTPNDAKLLGHYILHTGENPYGSVQAGSILIEGMTLAMYQNDDDSGNLIGYVLWDNPYYDSHVRLSECNGSSYMAIYEYGADTVP
ncbi:heterokaryon incompatibility protein [Rutstroemia sp. NJR-2017a BBW]|nr:heterokaryon incompatibility protein [Rutstroemia sp. NJR-2017a BBW]